MRVLSIIINLIGLGLTGYYFFVETSPPGLLVVLFLFYIGNGVWAYAVARHLNRMYVGWVILSLLLPFVTPIILAVLPKNPEDRMANADAAWARMDSSINLMMVTAIMTFDGPFDFERQKANVEHRLLTFDRFKQRIIHHNGIPFWEDDPNFDLDFHIQRVTLTGQDDRAELQALTSKLMSTRLDFSKPVWQFHFVENYRGGFAMIGRMHHCIADGIALGQVLLSLTDPEPDPTLSAPKRVEMSNPTTKVTGSSLPTAKSMTQANGRSLSYPGQIVKLAKLAGDALVSTVKLSLMAPDSRTIFRGEMGGQKLAAWSQPIPLQDIKDAGHKLGVTINDVMLASVTGALRRYMLDHEALPNKVKIRVMIPVDLRPAGEEVKLGNRFSIVFLTLPVGVTDPIARLAEVRQEMNRIKASQDALASFGILGLLGVVPHKVEELGLKFFGAKGTAVVSNVPGPRHQLYMAGNPLRNVMFWVPQAYSVSMGISLLSYAGKILLGVTTDTCLVKDPEAIITGMQAEIEILINLANQVEN